MSSEELTERLIGSFDCKQGAVRAVRFNGELDNASASYIKEDITF